MDDFLHLSFYFLQKRIPSGQKGPATVYTPQPSNWDHPVPVWAMRPPPSIWDPDYLQQLDPRYQLEQLRPVLPRPLRSQRKPTQVLPDGTIGMDFELKSVFFKVYSNKGGGTQKFVWGFYWGRNVQIQKIRMF